MIKVSDFIFQYSAEHAKAYGMPFVQVNNNENTLKNIVIKVLSSKGVMICEMMKIYPEQTLFPQSASFTDKETGKRSSALLEKLTPFMNDDLQSECIYDN